MTDVQVWLGQDETVPVVAGDRLVVTLPKQARANMTVKVVYDGPVPAPVETGAEVARLVITAPGLGKPIEHPLYAARDVEKLGPVGRIIGSLKNLIFGAVENAGESASN